MPPREPASSSSPAPAAPLRRSTIASGRWAPKRPCSPSIWPTSTPSTGSAPSIYQRFGRLDGLAACAAELGTLTPTSQLDPKTLQRVLTVNLLANHG